jgi:4-carboxymuconolactone decarboxylase
MAQGNGTMPKKKTGRGILDSLFGEGYSARRDDTRNSLNVPLFDFIEEVNFGSVWSRSGLDRKRRCEMTLAMLIAMNRIPQARAYMGAALTLGTTVEELREIILHVAVYAGLPAAVEGFKVAEEVLRERGLLD